MVVGRTSKKDTGRKEGKSSVWAFEGIREACEKVAKDEIGRLGTVQEILGKSTDFLRRIIAAVDGMAGVTLSYVCPHCNSFRLDDYIRWVSSGETTERKALQLVLCGLWRPLRMESAQQNTGGAALCECIRSEGVESARSAVGAV